LKVKLTPRQKKAFDAHRAAANEGIRQGCVPNFCSCSLTGKPCKRALKGMP
jgi:hypothetical protein